MSGKLFVLILVIFAVGGAYLLYSGQSPEPRGGNTPVETEGDDTNTAGMRAEENMVVVMEQRPGTTVTGMVYLAAPGYLVIHEDNNGEPGAVIGSSALLQAGESSGVVLTLSRASKDGETLHAMLHFEKGGNASFSATEDTPVPSTLGGPISGWFDISTDAPLDVPISI